MKFRPLLLMLVALCAGLLTNPARAQEPSPVTVDVRAGYDGAGRYRMGHWFPTAVTVANDGADVRAVITWSFPDNGRESFRYELDLPRGARKAVTLPILTQDDTRLARVAVQVDDVELVQVPVRLAPMSFEEVAVGILSSDRSLLNSLGAAELAPNTATTVVRLDPSLLPEDAALLTGLDTIVVHDLATASLSDGQRAALELWTRLGGELLVSGGPRADQTVPGLAAILPVEVGALRPDVPTDGLLRLVPRNNPAGLAATATASTVTPRPGAAALDRDGLLTAWDLGAGRVIFAAFDLNVLRTWASEPDLWVRVLDDEPRMALGVSFRARNQNLLLEALELPALRLPSTGVLLLMMLFYIVVVGPVNFLILRRMGRVELAWVTTPLLVAAFTVIAYGASFAMRGTSPRLMTLDVVQSFEASPQAQATSFHTIFSPRRRAYEVTFGAGALVTPGTFEGWRLEEEPVTFDGAIAGMRELLIDVSSLRTLMVEETTTRAPEVASALQVDRGQRVQGELRLAGNIPLQDAMVVYGDAAQELGDLRPGDTQAVDLRADAQNFPDQVSPTLREVFDRDRILNELFGYDRFVRGGPTFQGDRGIPDRGGVYLLGWAEAAAVEGQVEGGVGRWQGETLYIIKLGG